ncbi:terminase large subunit [Weissella phage WCP30]|uniref:terminase large subunit n=1 Tax=Weissella phage WCP30 TaxID=1837862 RepID=UPI000810FDCE|nr:terminase large subunit [Weissella phage WCP30]ANU78867.1 terminase [Weissella phage WCP30]
MSKTIRLDFPNSVDKAYYKLFNSKARYIALKGSRGSGKSTAGGYKVIHDIMKYPWLNWLVIRQYQTTQKDSTFSNLKQIINSLGLESLFKFTVSPLEITYLPNGTKIYFKGADDPLKLTSINPAVGKIARVWWEEAYELKSDDDFDKVDKSIRGILPEGGFYQHLLTFNPWSDRHWLKREFFDEETRKSNVLSFTTTYKNNAFLDDDFIQMMEEMKVKNPDRARVVVYGDWGIAEGLVFDGRFDLEEFNPDEIQGRLIMGLDFGFTNDPTAFIKAKVVGSDIYVFDGFYEQGLLHDHMARKIAQHGGAMGSVYADSASPLTIAELHTRGLKRIIPAGKGKDSLVQRTEFMKQYTYHIHPKVSWLMDEMSTYVYKKDKLNNPTNRPVDGDDHAIQALGYALEPLIFTNKDGSYMTYQQRQQAVKNIGL